MLGTVRVLGKKVTLSSSGTTDVKVPGVGEVRLDLSRKSVTSKSAAATALDLKVSVNPLKLNVAEVEGRVTLAQATCTAPRTAPPEDGSGGTGTSGGEGSGPSTQTGSGPSTQNLAETGGSSATPYLVGGAALLVAAGAGSLGYARRRRGAAPQGGRG